MDDRVPGRFGGGDIIHGGARRDVIAHAAPASAHQPSIEREMRKGRETKMTKATKEDEGAAVRVRKGCGRKWEGHGHARLIHGVSRTHQYLRTIKLVSISIIAIMK